MKPWSSVARRPSLRSSTPRSCRVVLALTLNPTRTLSLTVALSLSLIPTPTRYASQLQRLAAAFPKDLSEACPAASTGCALGGEVAAAALGASFTHRQAPGEPSNPNLNPKPSPNPNPNL